MSSDEDDEKARRKALAKELAEDTLDLEENYPTGQRSDPLGYDTSDPNYLWKMARNALTGHDEQAVDKEIGRVERRLGLTPRKPSRWRRLKRWVSHRRWRFHFWRKDRGW